MCESARVEMIQTAVVLLTCALMSSTCFGEDASVAVEPVGLSESLLTAVTGVGCGSMCCEGKNNSCHSTGLKVSGKGSIHSRCFCDEGCSGMGDCCFDYKSACKGKTSKSLFSIFGLRSL